MQKVPSSEIVGWVADYPEIAAVAVFVLGLVIARLLQLVCGKALRALDERWSRQSTTGAALLTPMTIRYAGLLLFWIAALLALAVALSFLNPQSLRGALELMATFVGRIAIAALILGAGHVLGLVVMAGAARLVEQAELHPALPRLVYAAVLVVAVITALAQLAVDTSFISQLLLILVALTAGALALAFAGGARNYVENRLAGRELRRFATGERIRAGGVEGTIVSIHATYAEVETVEGIVCLPASLLAWQPVTRLRAQPDA